MKYKKILSICITLVVSACLVFTMFFTGHAFVQFSVVDLSYLGTHRFDSHYADGDIYQDSTIRGTVGGGAGLTTLNAFRSTSFSSTPSPGLDYIGFYGVAPKSFTVDSKFACYVAVSLALPSGGVEGSFRAVQMMLGGTSEHPSYNLTPTYRSKALSLLEVPYYGTEYSFIYNNTNYSAYTFVFQIDSFYMGSQVNRFFFKWIYPIETYAFYNSPYILVSDIVVFLDNGASSPADLHEYSDHGGLSGKFGDYESNENTLINGLPDIYFPDSPDVDNNTIGFSFWVELINRIINRYSWLQVLLTISLILGTSAFLFSSISFISHKLR